MNKPNLDIYKKFNPLYFVISSGLTISVLMIIYMIFSYWTCVKNEEAYSYLESVLRVEEKDTIRLSEQYKDVNFVVKKVLKTKDEQHAHVLENLLWIMGRTKQDIIINSGSWLVIFFCFLFLNRLIKKGRI